MADDDLESMLGSLLGGDGKDAGLLGALIGSLSHGQGGSSLGGLLDSLARIARELPQVADRLTPEGEVPQASIEDLIRRRSG
ncbi:hypothetical protein [Streptomyces sp. NPDC056660]|uniref:hypothetical protein n=1 Tax=Streptomyces sp. NPDC056660 TaxID=3345897 RepID=UPI0036B10766